jgi:L-ascorbate metabolism protein UlaG (beta-lactamase superfamily)
MIVEKDGKKALVDPGNYSWNSRIPTQDMLRDIDYVLVTHAHPDHIDPTFASVVNEMSPNAIWYVTPSTKKVIDSLPGVQVELESSLDDVVYVDSEHADLTHWGACEDHTSFVLFGDILVGGDCHTLSSMHGATIFAAAVNGGPWGSIKTFLNMIAAMQDKPAKVLPLHDWHWKEEAKTGMYAGLSEALPKLGIEFVPLIDCTTVEI